VGGSAKCEPCRLLQNALRKRSPDLRPALALNLQSLNKAGALAAYWERKFSELQIKQLDSIGASIQAAVAKQGEGIRDSMPFRSFAKFVSAAVNGTACHCFLSGFHHLVFALVLISFFSHRRLPAANVRPCCARQLARQSL
jgi:hypothetical protein